MNLILWIVCRCRLAISVTSAAASTNTQDAAATRKKQPHLTPCLSGLESLRLVASWVPAMVISKSPALLVPLESTQS